MAVTVLKILKAIGVKGMSLERIRDGYFILEYQDEDERWAQKTVYVNRLRDLSFDQWVAEGRAFAAELNVMVA